MARANNSNNGDKGTYGRIMKNGKKKKATNSSTTTPKIKKISNNSSSSRKKVPPKSKHHIAKLSSSNNKRRNSSTSIKERVAASSSASLKKKKKSSKKLKYPGHSAPCPISKTSRKKAKKKKRGGSSKSSSSKRHQYQMTISECNNDVYLQRVNCPWYDDAQLDDTSTTQDNNNNNNKQHKQSSTTNNSTSSSIQLPNETILNQIDAEIHTFTSYVKLTPNEHKARLAFIKHVTELSVDQFEKNGNYNNNSSHYRFDGKGVTSTLNGGGRRKRSSHRCQEQEEEEETIHVAPFGSFATQQVCTFASDVDMCLWGVVKGAPSSKKNAEVFIGDDDSDDDDDNEEEEEGGTNYNKNKDGGDKRRRENDLDVILDNGSFHNGCPLLTESSLLRTMDAIQQQQGSSASAAAAATKTTGKKDEGVTSKADTASGNRGDLFFIDRVGEARPDVIDLCNTNNDKLPYVQPPPSQPVKSDNVDANEGKAENEGGAPASVAAAETDFQFVLDTRGVGQELGDKVEDVIIESSSSNNNADNTLEESSSKDCHQLDKSPEMKSANNETAKEAMDNKTDNSNSNLKDDQNDNRDTSDHEEEDSEVIVIDSDNSDDDSADKMSSYYNRQKNDNATNNVDGDRVSEARAASSSVILLDDDSSSVPSSDDEDEDGKVDLTHNYDDINSSEDDARQTDVQSPSEVLELSITSYRRESSSSITRGNGNKPSFGPTGKTRIHVISALQSLTRQLRRSSFTHTIECRSKARVPIINCSTRTGFEGDIAIGGHNGVDTSMYALSQVKRFRSFAPIVLILKVLMAQQGFDKPFTGGLGSYKLYVLVAYHIDCHLANGGNDRPSEILISLFFRYGCCIGKKRTDKAATTDLEQLRSRDDFVSSDGGLCELTPVFRLSDCVDMFRECHGRLTDRILIVDDYDGHNENKISFLSSIIDCYRLREARETSNRRAKLCDSICRPIAHNDAGKVNPGRRIGMVFSKNGAVRDNNNNMQRGPRGGIVPRTRSDFQAKKALRGNRDVEAIQRGMKNRKNNKKQKRDSSLTGFASSQHF